MADQNPYAQYAANPYAVYGAQPTEKTPTPQTPEQRENTIVGTQEKQQQIANTTFDNVTNLRKQFEALQPVQDFRTILPLEASAYNAGPNKAGDLDLIYAFGKIMDPNSVVREGEQVMATNVGGVSEKVKGYLDSLQGQGQLTPQQRQELVGEIRQRTHNVNLAYNQLRNQYVGIANKYGFNPDEIVGPHPAQPFLQGEADYIQRTYPNQSQQPIDPAGQGDIGFNAPRTPTNPFNDQQSAAFDAWIKANPNATPEQLKAFVQSIGVGNVTNADEVVKALQQTGRIQPASAAVFDKPDITDVRGGKNTGTQDAINAAARGVGDVVTMGGLDKLVALGDTVTKGGTFDQNLNRQYAISDFDQQNHPFARFGGQALGGAILPMGEVNSLGNLALKGAGYGAAYGVGSSRSLGDVPMNALLGGTAGAAVPLTFGGAGKAVNALRSARPTEIPPLVDPVTGRLNEPLEQAGPAGRVAAAKDFGIDLPYGSAGDRTAAIIEKKLDVRPSSGGVMNDSRRVVEGQVQNAVENVASGFGSARTLNEAGGELQRGSQQYIDRAKALTSKAYDAIPISPKAQTSTANTVATLTDLTGRFASNPELQQQVGSKQLSGFLDAIQSKGLSWEDMKSLRSFIGEKIGERRFTDDATTNDLRAVYRALSQDMQDTAQSMGPRALQAFQRANNLYRETQQRIDGALVSILGNDAAKNPNAAAKAVQNMTLGGKPSGDLAKLAQIRASTIKSGAWDEVAGALIRIGGQPADSPGRSFDPGTFVRWYSDMDERARAMLFKPELRKSLDQFVAVNQRLANSNALRNTSNTAMGTPTGTFTLPSAVALAAGGHPLMAMGLVLGTGLKIGTEYGLARLWTSPEFVQRATGYAKAVASGNANAVKSQIGRLQKLAATNPELREGIEAIVRSFANDNAPQLGSAVASPDQRPDQQQ